MPIRETYKEIIRRQARDQRIIREALGRVAGRVAEYSGGYKGRDGIVMIDAEGIILYANNHASKLLGTERPQGISLVRILDSEGLDHSWKYFTQMLLRPEEAPEEDRRVLMRTANNGRQILLGMIDEWEDCELSNGTRIRIYTTIKLRPAKKAGTKAFREVIRRINGYEQKTNETIPSESS